MLGLCSFPEHCRIAAFWFMASGESFLSSLYDQFSLGLFLAVDMKPPTTLMPHFFKIKTDVEMLKLCIIFLSTVSKPRQRAVNKVLINPIDRGQVVLKAGKGNKGNESNGLTSFYYVHVESIKRYHERFSPLIAQRRAGLQRGTVQLKAFLIVLIIVFIAFGDLDWSLHHHTYPNVPHIP